jgi:hypothetical protein
MHINMCLCWYIYICPDGVIKMWYRLRLGDMGHEIEPCQGMHREVDFTLKKKKSTCTSIAAFLPKIRHAGI